MPRCLFLLPLALLLGCDVHVERFDPNQVHALTLATSNAVGTESAMSDVADVVHELFGNPNDPKWPTEILGQESSQLISVDNLSRACGLVSSDKKDTHKGLFVEHCATCHALHGSGAGPAALFQNPYPRDFRAGIFKWKSTLRASKPTKDDLQKLLSNGVPGSAMPSFALIKEEDRSALVDYLIYLSVRGEVERRLLNVCIEDLLYDDSEPLDEDERLNIDSDEVAETLRRVVQSWLDAESNVVAIAQPSFDTQAEMEDSIARGKELFHSQIANCVGCHGPAGNGQAVTLDFDDWTKAYTTKLGITPTDKDAVKPFRKAGALRPRQIKPRNLQDGVFRGGGDSETLYRRISQGIAGTPMPGIEISEGESTKGLSQDQVWDLILYVQSLGDTTNLRSQTEHKK